MIGSIFKQSIVLGALIVGSFSALFYYPNKLENMSDKTWNLISQF